MSDRQGIEIDYCPQCRGVWLDRGELDKLIERSVSDVPQGRPQETQSARPTQYDSRDSDDYKYRNKKKSLLGELFDF